ncbi:alpha/beta fold hydrolase BchO [Pontivivens ytuae]|uniref:Alpha/beta fold hydrolase n=1 Tax=Pontivivens ytuae TaxID=2789856 RepID=A0A7S9LRZ0_9RHOB|nr:alpha/beta fold hydrolase BchO [Pontivivens ytuae]QPH54209.1 alpha/beta fold hydrolase [Pontivivens ytuae]
MSVPPDWPNRAASRTVTAPPHRWHVQDLGEGPTVLLIHGAGASTHSWRGVMAALDGTRRVAVDLPAQGFTRAGDRNRLGLAAMTADLAAMLDQEGIVPDLIVGHSAGAAIAMRLALDLGQPPAGVVGVNAALARFPGPAAVVFPAMARAMAFNPLSGAVISRLIGSRTGVRGFVEGTGSRIDAEGLELYRRLVSRSDHVDGTLAMMAQWELGELLPDLPRVPAPVLFLTGARDRSVPESTSIDAARRIPGARHASRPDLGHLLHEEDPVWAAERIREMLPR